MTASEIGIYITLIAEMYERDGWLEFDNRRLARMCGASAGMFKNTVSMLIDDGKLVLVDGKISNERVQEELSRRDEISQKASENRKGTVKKNEE